MLYQMVCGKHFEMRFSLIDFDEEVIVFVAQNKVLHQLALPRQIVIVQPVQRQVDRQLAIDQEGSQRDR